MLEQIRMMNAYLQAALEGREQTCREIVNNYAHVYRKSVKDVLAMISVGLMDPTGFSYKDYYKVKEMIIKQVPPRWQRLGFSSEEEMKKDTMSKLEQAKELVSKAVEEWNKDNPDQAVYNDSLRKARHLIFDAYWNEL